MIELIDLLANEPQAAISASNLGLTLWIIFRIGRLEGKVFDGSGKRLDRLEEKVFGFGGEK